MSLPLPFPSILERFSPKAFKLGVSAEGQEGQVAQNAVSKFK